MYLIMDKEVAMFVSDGEFEFVYSVEDAVKFETIESVIEFLEEIENVDQYQVLKLHPIGEAPRPNKSKNKKKKKEK